MMRKNRNWGLSTYISLILEISITEKKSLQLDWVFLRNNFTFQKSTRDHIFFTTCHMIQEHASGKVHIK